MENTRARILTAAAQLFEQQGYRSVSMRAIAAQLGISVGNLTYHFPHKQDIATALAEQEMTAIILPEEATLPALDGYLRRMLLSLVDHARMFDDPLLFGDLPGCQQENADRITRLQQNLERLLSQLRQVPAGAAGPDAAGCDHADHVQSCGLAAKSIGQPPACGCGGGGHDAHPVAASPAVPDRRRARRTGAAYNRIRNKQDPGRKTFRGPAVPEEN